MEAQENKFKPIENVKGRPVTSSQINPTLYAKWLTDKYNKLVVLANAYIEDLSKRLKESEAELKRLKHTRREQLRKYMDDKRQFNETLAKEGTIGKYQREIANLHKAISKLRNENYKLGCENIKLKLEIKELKN